MPFKDRGELGLLAKLVLAVFPEAEGQQVPVLDPPQQAFLAAAKDRRRRRAGDDETDGRLEVVILLEEEFPTGQSLDLVEEGVAHLAGRLDAFHEPVKNHSLDLFGRINLRIVEGKVQDAIRADALFPEEVVNNVHQRRRFSNAARSGQRNHLRQVVQVRDDLANHGPLVIRQQPLPGGNRLFAPPPRVIWG